MRNIILIFFLFQGLLDINIHASNIISPNNSTTAQVLLVFNPIEKNYQISLELIRDYLNHFGIKYVEKDVKDVTYNSSNDYSLIVISNKNIYTECDALNVFNFRSILSKSFENGAGIVSFSQDLLNDFTALRSLTHVNEITFTTNSHYITENHTYNEAIKLDSTFEELLPINQSENVLIKASGANVLTVDRISNGRIAIWSSSHWMSNKYLGQLRGLDDCFLKSLIWCAKKPFFVRGLLPIVTMRVDDVYGMGARWNESPFWWVKIANKYHFQPWLGLFLEYVDQANSVDELRELINNNCCTANPHSFTRPKFIYFDHPNYRIFDSIQSIKNMELVDAWYKKNEPLPKSTFLVPHFYEIGHVCADYAMEKWGIKYFGLLMGVDSSWYTNSKVIYQKPYNNYMEPFKSNENKSFAFSDYLQAGNSRLFSCLTEIRELGYDWAPQNNVSFSVNKGIRILKRGLESMVVACLMTHETDFLYSVAPENWESMMKQITESISSYNPLYLTMDSAMAILKSTVESKINSISYNGNSYDVNFAGTTSTPTSLYVYTEESNKIKQKLFFIPSFTNSYKYTFLEDSFDIPVVSSIIGGKTKFSNKSNMPESIVNDPFYYNNKTPLSQTPIQTDEFDNSQQIFTTKASDQDNWLKVNINIPKGYFLKAIDIWGKNEYKYDSNSSKDLILTISDGVYSYASSSIDLDTCNSRTVNYNRFKFEDKNFPYYYLANAKYLRIDHSLGNNNELSIAEIRPIIEKLDGKIILDTNEYSRPNDIEIIPNPVINSFIIYQSLINDESVMNIYNELGMKIYSKKIIGSTPIDGSVFPSPGVYFISIKGKIKTSFKKIIKI